VNDAPGARQSRDVTEPQREKALLEFNNPPQQKVALRAFAGKTAFSWKIPGGRSAGKSRRLLPSWWKPVFAWLDSSF
jgi:hypothetical protein